MMLLASLACICVAFVVCVQFVRCGRIHIVRCMFTAMSLLHYKGFDVLWLGLMCFARVWVTHVLDLELSEHGVKQNKKRSSLT